MGRDGEEEATPRRATGFAALNATDVCVDAIDACRFRRVALRVDDSCETISDDLIFWGGVADDFF